MKIVKAKDFRDRDRYDIEDAQYLAFTAVCGDAVIEFYTSCFQPFGTNPCDKWVVKSGKPSFDIKDIEPLHGTGSESGNDCALAAKKQLLELYPDAIITDETFFDMQGVVLIDE